MLFLTFFAVLVLTDPFAANGRSSIAADEDAAAVAAAVEPAAPPVPPMTSLPVAPERSQWSAAPIFSGWW